MIHIVYCFFLFNVLITISPDLFHSLLKHLTTDRKGRVDIN